MDSSLIQDEYSDFTLKTEARSCWITVDNISVYIVRTDEGVSVDLFPKGREGDESIAGTWALHQEAATEEELAGGMSLPWCTRPQIP